MAKKKTTTTTTTTKSTSQLNPTTLVNNADNLFNSSGQSTYTTNDMATQAAGLLSGLAKGVDVNQYLGDTSALTNAMNFKTNNLDDYSNGQLRKDYADLMNYDTVKNRMDTASDAAYNLQRAEQIQALNRAENANAANTKTAIADMRKNLIGSATSGANVGASNATALQALLGLGQQNAATTTEGMQNYQNAAKEAAATRAQNAVNAMNTNQSATESLYNAATSAYGSDKTALGNAANGAGQGYGSALAGAANAAGNVQSSAATATGQLAGTIDTNQTNNNMNNATNAANYAAQKLGTAATADTNNTKNTTKTTVVKK